MAATVLLLLGARRYSRKQRQGLARSAIGRYWCCSSNNSGYTEQRVQWYMAAAQEVETVTVSSDMRRGPSVRNLETEHSKGDNAVLYIFHVSQEGCATYMRLQTCDSSVQYQRKKWCFCREISDSMLAS